MRRLLVSNAFATSMVVDGAVRIDTLTVDQARTLVACGVDSAVGHADTAALFSAELGVEIPARRVTIALADGDSLLVGQYTGPRLPEGARALPDGATITWRLVRFQAR